MKRYMAMLIVISMLIIGSTPPAYAESDLKSTLSEFTQAYKEVAKEVDDIVFGMIADAIDKFTDVDEDFWGVKYIAAMFDSGVVSGYEDGTFRPDASISIAEFTTMLVNQEDYDTSVSGSAWYDAYVIAAVKNGVIQSGEFGPGVDYEKDINRGEMARMIAHAAGLEGVQGNIFSDDKKIDADYKGYVYAVAKAGIISGYEDGSFRASDGATRAEACVMLENLNAYRRGELETVSVFESKDYAYSTPYGDIRKPDLHVNDDIWTDDEFHRILTKDQDKIKGIFNQIDLKRTDDVPQASVWYYDQDERVFYLSTGFSHKRDDGYSVYEYTNMNEALGGDVMFQTMKAAVYHAYNKDMELHLEDFNYSRAKLSISEKDKDGKINLYLHYEPGDAFYNEFSEFTEDTFFPHEWELINLYNMDALERQGITLRSTVEEIDAAKKNIDYTEQQYVDFLYGVCDQVYGDAALDMYKYMVGDYIKRYNIWDETEEQFIESELVDFEGYRIFKLDSQYFEALYGVEVQ